MLNEAMIPSACETDVNGALTPFLLQSITRQPAFDTDIVALDSERDGVVLWHCGKAPLSMADPASRPSATVHSNRRMPLLMEFPLEPGLVTLARLSETKGGI